MPLACVLLYAHSHVWGEREGHIWCEPNQIRTEENFPGPCSILPGHWPVVEGAHMARQSHRWLCGSACSPQPLQGWSQKGLGVIRITSPLSLPGFLNKRDSNQNCYSLQLLSINYSHFCLLALWEKKGKKKIIG